VAEGLFLLKLTEFYSWFQRGSKYYLKCIYR